MLGTDTGPYLTNELLVITEAEANAFAQAADDLFEMLVAAGQHVIDHNRFAELGIPANLIDLIKFSWDDDQIHLYGRFDLAGGIDGLPIKLLEYNADTATCLPETAVVQWAQLNANGLDETQQFNTLFETLTSQFRYLREQDPDRDPSLLLSAMRDAPEDDANVALLGEAAREAGFRIAYAYVDEVEFSDVEGIFRQRIEDGQYESFSYWFKLIPWEYIAIEEPELAAILTEAVRNQQVVVLNPAYTLIFQSKAILKILWELYPNHALLLETSAQPLAGQPCVEKVLFGREGANIRLLDATGQVETEVAGDYDEWAKIYQARATLARNEAGMYYQAGVFYAGEACGLGFRRGGQILDNTAQFVGHLIG